MANVKEDYGINDPNLLAILGGINDPTKLAALSESNNGIGGVLVPGLQRRHDAQVRNALQMLAGNNLARASLHERQQDITRAKDEETYFANMADKLPGLVKEGVLPSDYLPFRRLIAPGSTGGSGSIGIATLLAQQGKKAWNNNQLAESYNRLDEAGYNIGEGGVIDPNDPNMPKMTKGPARSILEAIVRNQNDRLKVQFDTAGNRIGMEGSFKIGGPIPKNINDITTIGTPEPGFATPPAAEQEIRKHPSLGNAQVARLPNGKGFTAKYKSGGKDVVVVIPADAQGRPIMNQMEIVSGNTPTP